MKEVTEKVLFEEAERWKDRCMELVKNTKNTAFLETFNLVNTIISNYKKYKVSKKDTLDQLLSCGRMIEIFAK